MIRLAVLGLSLAGCASMPAPSCPPQMITAVICPEPFANYHDHDFRDQLAGEIASLPDGTALGKAASSYLAMAKKCERTL